jgi:hypothetical protein
MAGTKSYVTREDDGSGDQILTYQAGTGEEIQGMVIVDSDAAELIGQKAMAASIPVVMASNQSDINISLDGEDVHAMLVDSGSSELKGQKVMASSLPVVLASDHTDLPITFSTSEITALGDTKIVEVTASLDTSAYADGDVLAATQALTEAMRENGGHGLLHSVAVLDKDDQGVAMDIVILKTNVSIGTENSAVSITDSDAEEILGIVSVGTGDYVDLVASQHATITGIGLGVVADASADDLYFALITRGGTPTHTASGIVLQFTFFRDSA